MVIPPLSPARAYALPPIIRPSCMENNSLTVVPYDWKARCEVPNTPACSPHWAGCFVHPFSRNCLLFGKRHNIARGLFKIAKPTSDRDNNHESITSLGNCFWSHPTRTSTILFWRYKTMMERPACVTGHVLLLPGEHPPHSHPSSVVIIDLPLPARLSTCGQGTIGENCLFRHALFFSSVRLPKESVIDLD